MVCVRVGPMLVARCKFFVRLRMAYYAASSVLEVCILGRSLHWHGRRSQPVERCEAEKQRLPACFLFSSCMVEASVFAHGSRGGDILLPHLLQAGSANFVLDLWETC